MAKLYKGGQGQAQASQFVPNLAPARAAASDRAMAMREAYSNGVLQLQLPPVLPPFRWIFPEWLKTFLVLVSFF